MCYNVQYLTKKAEEYAARLGVGVDEINKVLQSHHPVYQVSGFTFPYLPTVFQNSSLQLVSWGFIPAWTKDLAQAIAMRSKTLNARLETMDQLPSYRNEAAVGRCLVLLDGFYEHHHLGRKSYPYFIQASENVPLLVAGLCSRRQRLNGDSGPHSEMVTLSIVTTRANGFMREIHNNPKLPNGPRMPLILNREMEEYWIQGNWNLLKESTLEESYLKAHTVLPLSGAHSPGNTPRASQPFTYAVIGLPM